MGQKYKFCFVTQTDHQQLGLRGDG